MTMSIDQPVLAAVHDLVPTITARADEIEAARRIPDDLVGALRDAGIFRMLVPPSHGGLGVDYPTSVEVLRTLARADGAVGWSLMIGAETPQLLSLLPRPAFDRIYEDGPDVTCGGAFAPKGLAESVDGGYRASGRWGFASGCEHSDWLFGNCIVPPVDPGGAPVMRCTLFRRTEWQILDTWDTIGLAGTGSHDIAIEDAFVPEEHTFDLFGGVPNVDGPAFTAPLLQFNMHIGAVALGIAEGAHTELVELAGTGRTRLYGRSAMADSELFQYRLGRCQADLRAAEALLLRQVEDYWRVALAGTATPDLQTPVRQAVAWVVETSAAAVEACYTAAGGSAVYRTSPMQRRLRDIRTLTQHAAVQEGTFATSGAALLGAAPGPRL